MGLRPHTTRWFTVVCAGDDVARAVEALARTDRVQIESEEEATDLPAGPALRARLPRFEQLRRRYQAHWPRIPDCGCGSVGNPEELLERGLAVLEAWGNEADPIITRLQALELEGEQLELLRELIRNGGDALPDLELFGRDHTLLWAEVLVLPPGSPGPDLPRSAVRRRVDGPSHTLILVVGPQAETARLALAAEASGARRMPLPAWIPPSAGEARAGVEQRLASNARELAEVTAQLEALRDRPDLRTALRDIDRLEWYVTQVPPSRHTRNFAVVTGWTDDPTGDALRVALESAEVCGVVDFEEPPPGLAPPIVLHNPWWARPFEVFARLVGVPSSGEVDPSALLSVIAPLLFGYMFGDVGHGLVLVGAGLILRRRLPALALLVPGGLAAMVFGFLFGSVFAVEDLIPALWLHPMEEPLILLGGALVAGVAILLIGLLLGGVSATYQGRLRHWLLGDAAVIAIYLGLLGMVLDRRAGYAALAGLAWFTIGTAVTARRHRLRAALARLGGLVERLMQLGVNTVSFARVGAFALAHAGLSAAIAGMTSHTGPVATAVILILGNLVVLVIEGLVVSIQTTRLILFEFFVRFLQAGGRAFTPLAPPTGQPDHDAAGPPPLRHPA